MDESEKDFQTRYGGSLNQRIEELEKLVGAYDDMNAVRVKHGLPKDDSQDVNIRIQMQKLEELVYGDFITGIRERLALVRSHLPGAEGTDN
jgi:hypothetical protein